VQSLVEKSAATEYLPSSVFLTAGQEKHLLEMTMFRSHGASLRSEPDSLGTLAPYRYGGVRLRTSFGIAHLD
jgi:hypothetical protein